MPLQLQNRKRAARKLEDYDVTGFVNADCSFLNFVTRLRINRFRHISNLNVDFEHPITVISGTNRVGKTSLLLILACSFEDFMKVDSTSPSGGLRPHAWNDVLSFTSHENVDVDYSYELEWRVGSNRRVGEGKRLANTKSWSGLGKKSSDPKRINAKIRDREARLIDLERVLPGRSFSNALFRKANQANAVRLNEEVEEAYSFLFDTGVTKIYQVGSHINKNCYLLENPNDSYSSFNAASGEEAAIHTLRDIIESPPNSLILVDEIEAAFHPNIQRKLAAIIEYISWRDKKQFIISTHSPTMISAFPPTSRKFIEAHDGQFRILSRISPQAARSKMDSIGHPLIRLYCEDSLAKFLIKKVLQEISKSNLHFARVFNIITSGAINEVKNDYQRHKRNFMQLRNKVGYAAIFDGDYHEDPSYTIFVDNPDEQAIFLYPYEAPEKFLVRAYLDENPDDELEASLTHDDHHGLFETMVVLDMAADSADARSQCYSAFLNSAKFAKHESDLKEFLLSLVDRFSQE